MSIKLKISGVEVEFATQADAALVLAAMGVAVPATQPHPPAPMHTTASLKQREAVAVPPVTSNSGWTKDKVMAIQQALKEKHVSVLKVLVSVTTGEVSIPTTDLAQRAHVHPKGLGSLFAFIKDEAAKLGVASPVLVTQKGLVKFVGLDAGFYALAKGVF